MMEGVTLQRVVQLNPKPQPFEDAVVAFFGARNADCLSALRHHDSFEASMLRTRALLRLRRVHDAESAVRVAAPRAGRQADVAQCYILLGTALERAGDNGGADEAFFNAQAHALSVPSIGLHTELALFRAHAAWMRRDLTAIGAILTEAFAERRTSKDEPHAYPLHSSRAFMYELQGLVCGHEGKFDDQIACYTSGLAELDALDHRDVWTESSLLDNLSPLVSDLYLPHVEQLVRKRSQSLLWSEETNLRAYDVHRSLGWHAALSGNVDMAMRDLREAHVFAPSAAWTIEALLDRSYILRELGELHSSNDQLGEAHRLAQMTEWRDADNEERLALLWLAENMAAHSMPAATVIADTYRSIRKPINLNYAAPTDKRFRAHELDALGAVTAMTGQTMRGLTMLIEARDIWDTLGFAWRAAKTARAIARVTRSENDIAEAVFRAEPWPRSWLSIAA